MDWFHDFLQWFRDRETLTAWIAGASVLTLIVSAIAVPMVIRRIPADYFLEGEQTEAMRKRHPVLRVLFLILKNLIGGILLLGGILMLLTPGQGLLTIVIGILLLDFPGKRKFEVWLISRKPLYRAIDWIRRRAGKESLMLPD